MDGSEPPVREISLDELVEKRRRGEPFILVNVLLHEDFEHIHIPGSINVPLPDLRELAPLLFGKDDQVIVYCSSFDCTASPTAAKILMQLGFSDVLDFAGGIKEWVETGQPVVHMPHLPEGQGEQAA
ncbi:MAG: rhodanese-like domain-containing protein [Armatimonadota bacterium]